METLLEVIAVWLAMNFELPVTYEHPEVRFVDQDKMIEVRARVLGKETEVAKLHDAIEQGSGFLALYDDVSRTIYLPEDWSAALPADVSLLVHEMVHHQQNANKLTHECEEAREHLPYRAQARWLELFGTTLEEEFGVDGLTLLVRTNCWH